MDWTALVRIKGKNKKAKTTRRLLQEQVSVDCCQRKYLIILMHTLLLDLPLDSQLMLLILLQHIPDYVSGCYNPNEFGFITLLDHR